MYPNLALLHTWLFAQPECTKMFCLGWSQLR